jgi:hypothetical protein
MGTTPGEPAPGPAGPGDAASIKPPRGAAPAMGDVRVHHEGTVPCLPEDAYAWWSDYQPGDHASPFPAWLAGARRSVVERDALGRAMRMRDEGRLLGKAFWIDVGVRYEAPHAIHEDSVGSDGARRGTYAFRPDALGCRVVWDFTFTPTSASAKALCALPGGMALLTGQDFRLHLGQLRRDLAARAGKP